MTDPFDAFHAFELLLYRLLETCQAVTEPLLGAHSYWFAIVLLTLTVRAALLPLVVRQVRSARAMLALQPRLRALRERYGDDRPRLLEETAKLTREHGVNPAAGCLPLLAQVPVFIALSRVILSPVMDGEPNVLRGHLTLGIDLGTSWLALDWAARVASPGGLLILGLIALAAVTTWLTQRLSLDRQPVPPPAVQRRLLQALPLVFPAMWVGFPLAAIVYWVTSTLWTLVQQWVVGWQGAAATARPPSTGPGQPAAPG